MNEDYGGRHSARHRKQQRAAARSNFERHRKYVRALARSNPDLAAVRTVLSKGSTKGILIALGVAGAGVAIWYLVKLLKNRSAAAGGAGQQSFQVPYGGVKFDPPSQAVDVPSQAVDVPSREVGNSGGFPPLKEESSAPDMNALAGSFLAFDKNVISQVPTSWLLEGWLNAYTLPGSKIPTAFLRGPYPSIETELIKRLAPKYGWNTPKLDGLGPKRAFAASWFQQGEPAPGFYAWK